MNCFRTTTEKKRRYDEWNNYINHHQCAIFVDTISVLYLIISFSFFDLDFNLFNFYLLLMQLLLKSIFIIFHHKKNIMSRLNYNKNSLNIHHIISYLFIPKEKYIKFLQIAIPFQCSHTYYSEPHILFIRKSLLSSKQKIFAENHFCKQFSSCFLALNE